MLTRLLVVMSCCDLEPIAKSCLRKKLTQDIIAKTNMQPYKIQVFAYGRGPYDKPVTKHYIGGFWPGSSERSQPQDSKPRKLLSRSFGWEWIHFISRSDLRSTTCLWCLPKASAECEFNDVSARKVKQQNDMKFEIFVQCKHLTDSGHPFTFVAPAFTWKCGRKTSCLTHPRAVLHKCQTCLVRLPEWTPMLFEPGTAWSGTIGLQKTSLRNCPNSDSALKWSWVFGWQVGCCRCFFR